MNKKRVTIREVALACGVTPQTVSRVFRNHAHVAPETRNRIYRASEELGYIPNTAAIRLRTGTAKSIAVVFDSLMNIYFSVMVEYLRSSLNLHGYEIQMIFAQEHIIGRDVYIKALSHGADALISFLEPDATLAEAVANFGVPVLIFGRRSDYKAIDYITTDDIAGGELAAKKLVDCGCKNIAYMAYGFGMTCVMDRFKGFESELKKYGIVPQIIDCTGGVAQAIEKHRDIHGLPDGIFCFNDIVAYKTIKAVRAFEKRIKIIGYDDIQADIDMPIELTTIGVDKVKYINGAVELLLEKLENGERKQIGKCVPVKLIEGETTI